MTTTTIEKIRDHLTQHGSTWITTAGLFYPTALAAATITALWHII